MIDKIKEGKVDQDTGIDALVEQNKSIISKIHQIEAQFALQPEAIRQDSFCSSILHRYKQKRPRWSTFRRGNEKV